MPAPTDNSTLRIAIHAVANAARLTRAVQAGIDAKAIEKKDRSPVTLADLGAQAIVKHHIAEQLPSFEMIAEESAETIRSKPFAPLRDPLVQHVQRLIPHATISDIEQWIDHNAISQYKPEFWTLDPIDGTKGFLRNEQYAIALARIVDGQVDLAVLACPNLPINYQQPEATGTLIYAIAGQGCWALPIDQPDQRPTPVHVTQTENSEQARFCESVESGHSAHGWSAKIAEQLNMTQPPVRLDSQAKYAVVARGQADLYMRLPTRPDYIERIWDHAAGCLCVTEAGGRVTDITGQPLRFDQGTGLSLNRGVLASNRRLHPQLLHAVETTHEHHTDPAT